MYAIRTFFDLLINSSVCGSIPIYLFLIIYAYKYVSHMYFYLQDCFDSKFGCSNYLFDDT